MIKIYKVEIATKKDYEQIRELLWSCFNRSRPLDKFELDEWFDEYDHYRSLVIRDDQKIVSHLAIRSYGNIIRGANLPLGGISYVATDHLFRNKGMARAITCYAFNDMKERGEVISILHPFKMAFYEKFGYTTTEVIDRYQISAENFRDISLPAGVTMRELKDTKEANTLDKLQKTMSRFGSMVFFRRSELEDLIKTLNCFLFEKNGEPIGWVKFFLYPNDFLRTKLVTNFYAYKNGEALRAIVHLMRIFALEYDITTEFHDAGVPVMWEGISQIPIQEFVKDRFALKIQRVGGFMIRIIDFKKYCEMIKIPLTAKNSVIIEIKDELCPWNTGIWKLTPNTGKIKVIKTNEKPDLLINDLQLSRIACGITSPLTLQNVGIINCTDETAANLDAMLPKESFYVWNRDL